MIMQSSGGVATPDVTEARPATTLLSGPAAGPKAALSFTRPLGHDRLRRRGHGRDELRRIAGQGRRGRPGKSEGEINRLRIALPMLDITTIGAGGGSIGFVDSGGGLCAWDPSRRRGPGTRLLWTGRRAPRVHRRRPRARLSRPRLVCRRRAEARREPGGEAPSPSMSPNRWV